MQHDIHPEPQCGVGDERGVHVCAEVTERGGAILRQVAVEIHHLPRAVCRQCQVHVSIQQTGAVVKYATRPAES